MKIIFYILLFSFFISCKNSNSNKQKSADDINKNLCPLKQFEVSETSTTIDNGSIFKANLDILIDLSKKYASKIDAGVQDTTFFDRIKSISTNKKNYSKEFLERQNPFIQAVCAPFEIWQDTTNSNIVRQENYVLYQQMLKKYFDFLNSSLEKSQSLLPLTKPKETVHESVKSSTKSNAKNHFESHDQSKQVNLPDNQGTIHINQ